MPVQFVDPQTMPRRPLRVMLYGPTRIGKTTSAATFPSPVFLSAGLEGGDLTLRAVRQQNPNLKVAQINSTQDMLEAIDYVAKNPRFCETIVVDSITYYCDIVISEIIARKGGAAMALKDWGLLDAHVMKNVLPKLHRLPQHIVWVALEQVDKDGNGDVVIRGLPMLYGKQASKLPAATDLIIHMDKQVVLDQNGKPQEAPLWQVAPFGNYIAGGRFGTAFPEGVVWPHWSSIADRIGHLIGVQAGQPNASQSPASVSGPSFAQGVGRQGP